MRNGYRIFDADTHFHASAETLEPFLDPILRDMKDELQTREFRTGWAGEEMPEPYTHLYRLGQERGWGEAPPRVLGEAGPRPNAQRHFQNFQGFTFPTPGGSDWDSDIRVRDMDEEGVDVHLMVPGAASGHPDPAVDMAMLRTVHRQLDDMCSRHPGRLTSLILATARDVEGSVLEISGTRTPRGRRASGSACPSTTPSTTRTSTPSGPLPTTPGSPSLTTASPPATPATATSGTTPLSDAQPPTPGARCG